MSTPPVLSALDPGTQMFPTLTPAQVSRLRSVGKVRHVEKGEVLFRPGDTCIPFFVLLSGRMEIVQLTYSGELPITTHEAGAFTGEVTMISGQPSLVLGRVTEAGEFLHINTENLRSLIAKDAEMSEVLMRAFILRRVALVSKNLGNVVVLGSRYCAGTLRIREFLSRNGYPYTYVDLDTDKASQELLDRFSVNLNEVPVVICNGRTVLKNPTADKLADCLGLNFSANLDIGKVHDVIIVGAGPAGLGAAVYAASEGLDCLLIETEAPGGQAAASSKIENYLGFPTGVSGQELAARALHQAQKFGAKMLVAHSIVQLDCARRPYKLVMDDGNVLSARTIIIATGAQYKKPACANLAKFQGQGVYYGATYMEAQLCTGEDVIVVGGGNSAGQAAVFLSQNASKVYMLVRSANLTATMSRYLIQRITDNPAIELNYNTEITGVEGGSHLESVRWTDKTSGNSTTNPIRHVFVMTGASPRTDWLRGCLALDDNGFVLTGRDLDAVAEPQSSATWTLARAPYMLETSLPGVFAVGDVRSGNVKRVASAVGEGAIAVHLVHRALADI